METYIKFFGETILVRHLVLFVLFMFLLHILIYVVGCSENPAPPDSEQEKAVVVKDVSWDGLNPWDDTEYWEKAMSTGKKSHGAKFTCVHGIPVLHIAGADQFEIIPTDYSVGKKAWKYCLKEAEE